MPSPTEDLPQEPEETEEDVQRLYERAEAERKIRGDTIAAVLDAILYASSPPGKKVLPQWTPFCKAVINVVKTNQHEKAAPSVVWLGDQSLSTSLANTIINYKDQIEHLFPPEQKPDEAQRNKFFADLGKIIWPQRQGNKVTM